MTFRSTCGEDTGPGLLPSPITPAATGKAALWTIRESSRDGTLEPFLTPGGDESCPTAPPSPTPVGEGGVGVGVGEGKKPLHLSIEESLLPSPITLAAAGGNLQRNPPHHFALRSDNGKVSSQAWRSRMTKDSSTTRDTSGMQHGMSRVIARGGCFRSKSGPGNTPGSPHTRYRACAVACQGLTRASRKAG